MTPSTVLTVVLLVFTIITDNVSSEPIPSSEPADVPSSSSDSQVLDCSVAGKCLYLHSKHKKS